MNDQKYMWSYAGTAMLISIWSQTTVQKQLKATLRNQGIWDNIARFMCRKGFNVNGRQCRTRIKNILVRYREAKKSGNISGTGIEPYFHDIDRVMTLRNAPIPCSALPYVPPDPLSSDREESHQHNTSEICEVNVKHELALPSNASEEDSQDISQDPTSSQLYFRSQDDLIDDDQSSSSTHVISVERMKSSTVHAAEKCKTITQESPPPTSTDSHETTQTHHNQGSYLEQLLVRAIESQTEAVTRILTYQHNLAKQLLEADRERQMRLEYKLDSIIERLDHFMPPVSLSRTSKDYKSEEKNNKLNCLLNKLDQVLPFIPSSVSAPKQREFEKVQEDKVERILNKLDQLFPLSASTSNKLNYDD
ncbi:uncharacterized protein [Anabrus simplex]|uniref:uncharacterized protein n=1 Tax=Anabrus simplex TaxID=316456 RepID=UPI0035A37EA9